ncbi:MAG: peptidylprolyl isomerase [Rhodospirillales bacterium]
MRLVPVLFALMLCAAAPAGTAAAAEPNPVVARVDGIEITLGDMFAAQAALDGRLRAAPLERIFEPLLERVIAAKLLAREAEKAGLDKMDDVARAVAGARERILQDAALRAHLETSVTDARIREEYAALTANKEGRLEIHARHILLDAEERAAELIAELNNGADFAALAREHSTGPSAPNGGDLGFFTSGAMVEAFSEAAFAMADGEYSKAPVQTQFGWHVIKVLERRTPPPPSYEEAAPAIQDELARAASDAYIKKLRSGAAVERFNPDGSPKDGG